MLKPLKEGSAKRSTNIIIKGALTSVKSAKGLKKLAPPHSSSGKKKKDTKSENLMEKLLSEITAKYKSNLCKDKTYLERLEKKTMV